MAIDMQFVGNAGGTPETKTFQNGNTSTTVSVAVGQGYFDQSHNWVDQGTAWFRVQLFGKQPLSQARYITKGTKVLVNGSLKVREYQDQQGQTRQSLDVTARHVGIIHVERQQQGQQSAWGQQSQQPAQAPAGDPWGGNAGSDAEFGGADPNDAF